MVTVRIRLWAWDERIEQKTRKTFHLKFRGLESREELKDFLTQQRLGKMFERSMEEFEQELELDKLGITSVAIREIYSAEVNKRIRSPGGNDATGKRKTMRECRGKMRGELNGNWDDNL